MRRRIVIYVLAGLLSAGGIFVWSQQEPAPPPTDHARLVELIDQNNTSRRARYQAALVDYREAKACREELQPFLRAEANLNSRLSVGLNFSAYGHQVGNLTIAYDRMKRGRISDSCESDVWEPGRKGLNQYIYAQNQWNDCIRNLFNCSLDDIEPDLQAKWKRASSFFKRARAELRNFNATKPEPPQLTATPAE